MRLWLLSLLALLVGCAGHRSTGEEPVARSGASYITLHPAGEGVASTPVPVQIDPASSLYYRWSPETAAGSPLSAGRWRPAKAPPGDPCTAALAALRRSSGRMAPDIVFSPRPPALWSANGRRIALNLTCQLYLRDPVGLTVIDLETQRGREGGPGILSSCVGAVGGWERKTLRHSQNVEGIAWRSGAGSS